MHTLLAPPGPPEAHQFHTEQTFCWLQVFTIPPLLLQVLLTVQVSVSHVLANGHRFVLHKSLPWQMLEAGHVL